MKIIHNSRKAEYREPFGAAKTGTKVSLTIKISDPAPESVRLMLWHGDDPAIHYLEMSEKGDGRYAASFPLPDEGGLIWYAFEIETEHEDERAVIYYGNNTEDLGGEGRIYVDDPHRYQITVYKEAEVPAWYRDGIVYQIFPDRFARDDSWRERTEAANRKINDRRSDMKRVIQEDWTKPAYYVRDGSGKVIEWPMMGGSLKGIEERLDYLKSLGVTCIYLNPVFEASSNHRYDTGDYMHIDAALGTDEDFEELAAAARERGMRIILDGVFSHTGADSIYFDKTGNYSEMHPDEKNAAGAWGSEDSPYRKWFKFDENESCGYSSWWGVVDLPEVDENNSDYRKFILGEDGVVAHWMKKGASGWRLDVADELPDSFIAETRKRIKAVDPEGLLLGEVWEDASNKISYGERRKYFMGDELDSTMHYPLRDILLDYINYTTGSSAAVDRMMNIAENYPPQNFYATLNLLGSHDRARIMTMMAAEEDYKSATKKVKVLSTLQYCLPGVPCIYYGDEAGLLGGTDPANRSGYPWGFENLDLGYHYRMLGLLYDEHPVLKDGGFEFLSGRYGIDEDILAFTRTGKDVAGTEETILVLANRRYESAEIDLSGIDGLRCGYALELLSSEELPLDEKGSLGVIKMESLSAMVISLRKEKPEAEKLGRSAGVICHISSLPEGKLGKGAKDFVDKIASAGFTIWQVLPVNPAGVGNSPYSSFAAFAGEPAFIDYDELPDTEGYRDFVNKNAFWLHDYIAFNLIKDMNDGDPWFKWPDEYKNADVREFIGNLTEDQKAEANRLAGEQYCFYKEWNDLKAYANSKGVRIMGDLPMYMAADSADVWADKHVFRMDEDTGAQSVHAGVPPDAFSGEGQDWGNPLYDWDVLKKENYEWWFRRIRQCAERFDILRVDHFRGLSEYYAIPEGAEPKEGCWQHSGGLGFIAGIRRMLRDEGLEMKILVEDLGYLDAGVKNLLKLSGLPGMDIWQFTADYMKEMCEKEPEKAAHRAFYTGTHDNNTLVGWLREKTGRENNESHEHGEKSASETGSIVEALAVIRKIYESPAELAMVQVQDVLMLGEEARMNVPGVPEGNWTWKMPGDTVEEAFLESADRLKWFRTLAERTGRLNGKNGVSE